MNQKSLGLLLMAFAAAMLGIATILMKWILLSTQLSPGQVAIWRFIIAAPLMSLFILMQNGLAGFFPNSPSKFIGLGVIFSIASLSAVFALERLSSSIYVIIVYLYPSLVVLYALFTGHAVPKFFWLGLPLTFIGLFLTAYDFNQKMTVDWMGVLITLLNSFAVAVYMLRSETVFRRIPSRLTGTNAVFLGGMLVSLLMIPIFGLRFPDTWTGWLLLLSFGVFGTFAPILAMNYGLQLIGAARGSIMATIQPVLTVLISLLIFNDVLTLQQILGGVLVIGAVALLQLSPDQEKQKLKT
ncbi:MAG: DMT family transporter [Anaerolineales bacterium]